MTMRFWTILAAAVALAFPAAAADWTVKQGNGYRIEMPGAPVETPVEAEDGIASSATYTVDNGDYAVAFSVLELEPEAVADVPPAVLINAGLDGAINEMGSIETGRRDVVVKGATLAREVTYRSPDGESPAFKGRGIAAIKGTKLIFVIGLADTEAKASSLADVDRALASMSFVGP